MTNGPNGHDPRTGRFAPGNRAAVGRSHPHAAKVYELRQRELLSRSRRCSLADTI